MLDKRMLKHRLQQLHRVKTWQLLVILFFSVLLAATLLRLNNIEMSERRQAVIEADSSGDQQKVRTSLIELQRYVTSHMNTSLGNGVYLEKAYARDRDAAVAAATETSNPNSAVYQQAAIECRARFQGGVESFRNDYVTCVAERVGSLSSGRDNAASLKLPRADNYRFDYVSPLLSFDIAGFVVILCLLIIAVILSRLAALIVLRLLLQHRYKNT